MMNNMPKSFKVSLILCSISLVCALVAAVEFSFGEFEFWKNDIPYRYSGLSVFFSVTLAAVANTWSLVRCLWIGESLYAIKNVLLYFFPLGFLFFLMILVGSGV
ncbi:hypothetical protein RYZ26_19200 [Terasakiella sp. A23]|uniref:hypothetical protein n=1 Tax=Terasakiella sp. FCG-A23 TaxID=3080561 RepID=UPI0029534ACE|nr:hypothetical protein [Terasakiella sp. A23]MDV7341737.1 hypothetical protein [Terasakiella sp. A23]